MNNLEKYIFSTFNYGIDIDAKRCSKSKKLKLLNKEIYYVYALPIPFANFKEKQAEYTEHIKKHQEFGRKH